MIDASSKFQASLPVSSDYLIQKFRELGIAFEVFEHEAVKTVAESKKVEKLFLSSANGGGHIKNLFLRDAKKKNILLVASQDTKIDLKMIANLINCKRLSFGSSDRLFDELGVRPGAVTPFSMITGVKNSVELFMQSKLRECKLLYAHPLVNDRTVSISIENLTKFMKEIGVRINWVNF
ncbi:MAG: prolyl-tRNA synthetase associated domain-containing protein [Paracoccaceae bacterium]|nr:MAG: prolyl-tRNA synthetase associated domain-containing protein [Paracoccaceae bacterium]